MRHLSILLLALILCVSLPCFAAADGIEISALVPQSLSPSAEELLLDLYCGPTQGFYRHNEQTIDAGKPYVYFGQYDCWAMVAQGTPEAFGSVGWVEAGFLADLPAEPQLAFEDGLQVTVEDEAILTDDPENPNAEMTVRIVPGTVVTLLAAYGDYAYVQAEFSDIAPVRAFIPMSAVE